MTDESRWIEFMVNQEDLMVLELAVRHIEDEYIEHYVMLNDEAKFEYAGNVRRLKSAINCVCKPESETADRLRQTIDDIVAEQDAARGVAE